MEDTEEIKAEDVLDLTASWRQWARINFKAGVAIALIGYWKTWGMVKYVGITLAAIAVLMILRAIQLERKVESGEFS